MSLISLPVEILDEICSHLSSTDIFDLVRVSHNLHAQLIQTLYHLARHHKKYSNTTLTTGLQNVTFWFDKGGNDSVVEWAITHGRLCTFEKLVMDPKMDLLQTDSYGSHFYIACLARTWFHI